MKEPNKPIKVVDHYQFVGHDTITLFAPFIEFHKGMKAACLKDCIKYLCRAGKKPDQAVHKELYKVMDYLHIGNIELDNFVASTLAYCLESDEFTPNMYGLFKGRLGKAYKYIRQYQKEGKWTDEEIVAMEKSFTIHCIVEKAVYDLSKIRS